MLCLLRILEGILLSEGREVLHVLVGVVRGIEEGSVRRGLVMNIG